MARSSMEIKAEILENAKRDIKPTRLMYSVNISWRPMQLYLKGLTKNKLIEKIIMNEEELRRNKQTRVKYRTTEKGIHILKLMKEVIKNIE